MMNSTMLNFDMKNDFASNYAEELDRDIGPFCRYIIIYQNELMQRLGYDLQNFVEDTLRVNVEDVIVFRRPDQGKFGIAGIEFTSDVPISSLDLLDREKISQIRAFKTRSEFETFMKIHSLERLNLIQYKSNKGPLVYISNFPGSADELKEHLKKFGSLSLVREVKAANTTYHIAYFDQEASASLACKSYNNIKINNNTIKLRALYPNAYRSCFAVRGAPNRSVLSEVLAKYGNIRLFQEVQDGKDTTYLIEMESDEQNKACCMLLHNQEVEGSTLQTFFVDKDRFMVSRNQKNYR